MYLLLFDSCSLLQNNNYKQRQHPPLPLLMRAGMATSISVLCQSKGGLAFGDRPRGRAGS